MGGTTFHFMSFFFALQIDFRHVCEIMQSFSTSVRPSILPSAWDKSVPTERIFVKFDVWVFFQKSVLKFQV